MKTMKKIIKKNFGEIILITGTGVFFYNILNFSNKIQCERVGPRRKSSELIDNLDCVVEYYYNLGILLLISIGAMLIVSGILIIKNKQK